MRHRQFNITGTLQKLPLNYGLDNRLDIDWLIHEEFAYLKKSSASPEIAAVLWRVLVLARF